ncbi:hypothetical protein BC827DRAFT_1121449 [Russula dissimulans]|nr:hypothetical protein BC827DRAFT_1121449 [Russula dissimulans]
MVRARLSVADILHRGVVLSLVGVCIWGIGTGIFVHRDTVRMGRGSHISSRFRSLPADKNLLREQKVQEANEQRWAEAAQAVFRGRSSKTT